MPEDVANAIDGKITVADLTRKSKPYNPLVSNAITARCRTMPQVNQFFQVIHDPTYRSGHTRSDLLRSKFLSSASMVLPTLGVLESCRGPNTV